MSERAPNPDMNDADYLASLRKRIADQRVPYTGSVELTHRCNLKCVHCYVGDQCRIGASRGRELTTDQWLRVIDQVAAQGCLEFLITGGEPLVRQDFAEIYRHAKRAGMIVTLFTNGTLVTDAVLNMFSDLPPFLVEISLYGATARTHEAVTQIPGSFGRMISAVENLLARGIRVGLKTVLMTLNRGEYREMEDLARAYGVKWRLDSALFPCLPNSDSGGVPNRCSLSPSGKRPLDLRVEPAQAARLELSDSARAQALRDAYVRFGGRKATDALYTCGAGLTGFHVDPYGTLQPCMMTGGYGVSLVEIGFVGAWKQIARIRDVKAPPDYECNRCDKIPLCSGCPALFDLENGAAHVRSEYICALTRFRFESIQKNEGAVTA